MIRFPCPSCRAVLQVPAALAGQVAACSRCSRRFRVPVSPPPAAIPVRQVPPPLPPPPPVRAVVAPRPAPRRGRRGSRVGLVLVLAGLAGLGLLGGGTAYLVWGRGGPEPREEQTGRDTARDRGPTTGKDGARKIEPPPEPISEQDVIRDVLAAINLQRGKARLKPLHLDAGLARGCREHALYLARNLPSRPDLDLHSQDGALPGGTAAGTAVASRASVLSRPPLEAVKAWLAAPAHRALLLDPSLSGVGVGFARQEAGDWLSVFDLHGGRPAPAADSDGAVLFPAPLQTEVPLTFPGNEIPDPLPLTKEKLAGYPVTVTFPPRPAVTGASGELEDEAGREVPLWFSSPEKPANERHLRSQQNTICLFARQPLRPGTRYLVRIRARHGPRDWSRTWAFVTSPAARLTPLMYQRALTRINEVRKFVGHSPVRLDSELSAGCIAHARYLARHLDRVEGLRADDERQDLPGFSPFGKKVAERAAIRLGGGAGPIDAVDWMLASVLNRHLLLNPGMESIGLGTAQQAPRGWIWVISTPPLRRKQGVVATPYPGKDQQNVPLYFGRELGDMVAGQPKGRAAGFAVTANFLFGTKLEKASAQLSDAGGEEVPCWLSTPQKRLPGTGRYAQLLLIPKKPLESATTYTVKMSAEANGQPWSESWHFTTIDLARYQAEVGAILLERLNQARTSAGLSAVTIDDKLSDGCRAHARYIVRNLEHARVQGLGIHDEDPSLPDATPAGARAGRASVIALISDPTDSVASWLATLYHRIPLLDPNLKRIGYGQQMHPFRGWVTVLDAGNGR